MFVDRLFPTIELTLSVEADADVANREPTWAVKEEIELPVYWLTEAATEEICWDTRVVAVAFVTIKEPTWAVKEEMELPVYWFIKAAPEDILITFTSGVLIALIDMLPVERLNAFIWPTLATDAVKVLVWAVKEDTLLAIKLLTVALVAVSSPVCCIREDVVLAIMVSERMLLVVIRRAPIVPTYAVKEEMELPVY